MSPNPNNELNVWSTEEAARWAGVNERLLHDWLSRGLLPAIAVGKPHTHKMKDGTRRHRRVYKWLVPKQAFIKAWENFRPVKVARRRRPAA
jgi:hypothetical protein